MWLVNLILNRVYLNILVSKIFWTRVCILFSWARVNSGHILSFYWVELLPLRTLTAALKFFSVIKILMKDSKFLLLRQFLAVKNKVGGFSTYTFVACSFFARLRGHFKNEIPPRKQNCPFTDSNWIKRWFNPLSPRQKSARNQHSRGQFQFYISNNGDQIAISIY